MSDDPKKKLGRKMPGNSLAGILPAFAESDEVIAPRDELAGGGEATFEEMEAGGAIVVVVKIVFAGPEELDGNADLLGDGGGFEHVVIREAAAESATSALHVHDDVVVRDAENFCNLLAA